MEHSPPRHITALEHDVIPISMEGSETSLSEIEADALLRLAETRPGFCNRRYRSVRLAQHCGVVNLGQRVLEILPKVGPGTDAANGRGVLLRLLRASAVHEGFSVLPARQQLERSTLLEMFIAAFMDGVADIVRGGLLRTYAQREEDLRVVRGRIALTRQFGVHFNRPDLVASRYDEHTADNTWNRLVKAALRVCRSWIVSGDLYRRWIELMAALDEVTDVIPNSAEFDRLVFNRQAARYRRTMDWVRWILALLSPALRAGAARAPSFLFDMNRVFELAVANVLRRRLAEAQPGLAVQSQASGRYLARLRGSAGRGVFDLRPDLVVREGRAVRLIGDAKWKRLKTTRSGHLKPARSDMYQMHAYAAAFRVDHIALIYPSYPAIGSAPRTEFLLPRSGTREPVLSVVCVDVHSDDLPITTGTEAFHFSPAVA
jgi:5-methylcytosine-specific restriction enzyme subunit McrC